MNRKRPLRLPAVRALRWFGVSVLSAGACTLLAPGEDEFTGGPRRPARTGGQQGGGETGEAGGSGLGGLGDAGHGVGKGGSAGRTTGGTDSGEAGRAGSSAGESSDPCAVVAEPCTQSGSPTADETCGACNTGMRTRMRTCQPDCTWSEWGEWSECSGVTVECMPGEFQDQPGQCGPCNTGTQTRRRSCDPTTCTYGGWGPWSACGNITAQCEPMHWQCCGAGAWMWCRDSTCQWTGDCDYTSCQNSPYCTC